MRYDYFILWGNGIDHSSDIINIIRNDENYDILHICEHIIDNMDKFVTDIYECDTVPMSHLISKTRYLLKSPSKCVFILVINKEPDEREYGDGAYRHIQCRKIKDTKTIIRNKFNPPFGDKNRRISPLDVGVSHDHCIHSSDYESQVYHVLEVLGLKGLI